jgi:hypothetical protein
MLETFVPMQIKTSGASIHVMKGGSGEPLLLLHGYPQTHMMWHKIAPRLAESFTVITHKSTGSVRIQKKIWFGDRLSSIPCKPFLSNKP